MIPKIYDTFPFDSIFKVQFYLFFTNLVHQYKIESEIEGQMPTEEYHQGRDDYYSIIRPINGQGKDILHFNHLNN